MKSHACGAEVPIRGLNRLDHSTLTGVREKRSTAAASEARSLFVTAATAIPAPALAPTKVVGVHNAEPLSPSTRPACHQQRLPPPAKTTV